MKHKKIDKRTRLIEATSRLVYQHGFNQTTLADIAEKSKVPLGNVYYYFKTKDEIGHALIEYRTGRMCDQFSEWDKLPDPRKRILAAIKAVADNREVFAQNGCPIGSLCQELNKGGGSLADKASDMFSVLLQWFEVQFRQLGVGKESSDHALHLVSALQGASLLTNTLNDPTLMLREATQLKQWVNTI